VSGQLCSVTDDAAQGPRFGEPPTSTRLTGPKGGPAPGRRRRRSRHVSCPSSLAQIGFCQPTPCLARLLDWLTAHAQAGDWLTRERDNVVAAVHRAVEAGAHERAWTLVSAVHADIGRTAQAQTEWTAAEQLIGNAPLPEALRLRNGFASISARPHNRIAPQRAAKKLLRSTTRNPAVRGSGSSCCSWVGANGRQRVTCRSSVNPLSQSIHACRCI
jgi:hypothetical protein